MAKAIVPWWLSTRTVYCIGRNYAAHATELGNAVPKNPFWFMKPAGAIIGPGTPHHCFPGKAESHHEVELGVIIGSAASGVSPSAALRHVAGYCLALDFTDRPGQAEAKQKGLPWAACKGFDTSCPVSSMVPASDVPSTEGLSLWLKVNGQLKQSGKTSGMLFSVPQLISALSRVHTLYPGDLILTGSPEGVGPVRPGDVVTAGIPELGLEINVAVAE